MNQLMKISSGADLDRIKAEYEQGQKEIARRALICAGTGCVANGSLEIYAEMKGWVEELGRNDISVSLEKHDHRSGVRVDKSGCHGFCEMGPLVRIEPEGILYVKVKLDDVPRIVEETLLGGAVIEELLFCEPATGKHSKREEDINFYKKQRRRVLGQCGHIDPEDIREYIARDGYQALKKALTLTPEEVCREVLDSGLRGRGGGGFPTGRKWQFTREAAGDTKYVVCNGDEGDPGAFMDRSLMEGDPHRVLEGMMIAGYAVGASFGYIYVRAEYPLAVRRLKTAIKQARECGLLGKNILGSGFSFDIKVKEGAGAFVCGEETALLASIEGKRGMPRPRPPYPAVKGLWGKPTLLNNVETFGNIRDVINLGAQGFRSIGTEGSPGTKTFALTGQVNNSGLIEVPMGITLREIVFDIGGGIKGGRKFKAVQIGGPSGGCLTEEHLDIPIDFDSVKETGAIVGSGGLVVMDETSCMVEVARFFMNFVQNESCGKCVPCREGTKEMLTILERITSGKGTPSDIELLEELAETIQLSSLCGLGQTAPNPVLTTLRYFRDEYTAHVLDKRCPAGVCEALKVYRIDPELCKGCGKCARTCPVGAISGERRAPHVIDPKQCIKCGSCREACPFGAVEVV